MTTATRQTRNLCLGLACFALLAAGSAEDSESNPSSGANLDAAEYTVNYKALADEFEANSVAAESKYEGRVIHVQGPIHSIDKDFSGNPYITLSGTYDLAIIRCEISGQESGLENLRKGQYITIGGVVGDTTMGVSLDPCKVIDSQNSNSYQPTPTSEPDNIQQELNAELNNIQREMESAASQLETDLNNAVNTSE